MPKFLVTNTSRFTPFTYDELVKPVERIQEVHDQTQEAYDKMAMETAALERYISNDNPDDELARSLYNNYRQKLDQFQDNLWNNGVNAQTRRNLSDARIAYASDINRLAEAIKTRKERSKEYWDAISKDRSIIAGEDPGLAGLDNYLRDDLYGRNYYSYSGNTFASEVGADVKARADEMLSDPEFIRNNPDLVGYILEKKKKGFSSDEVARVGTAARAYLSGDDSYMNNLTPGEKILAGVLFSHLQASGAVEGLKNSPDKLARMLEYGIYGLSQGIGTTDYGTKSDKEWDLQADLFKSTAKQEANTTDKKKDKNKGTYTIDVSTRELVSPTYDPYQKIIGDIAKKYGPDKQVVVAAPDGTSRVFTSFEEATNEIYNPECRQKGRQELYGFDVADTSKMQTVTIKTDKGDVEYHTTSVPDSVIKKYNLPNGAVYVRDKNDNIIPEWTNRFNKHRKEYLDHVNGYEKANPNINLEEIAVNPEKEKEIRKLNEINGTTDSAYVFDIANSKNYKGEYRPAALVTSSPDFDTMRKMYARKMMDSFTSAPKDSNGRLDKRSAYGFYQVGQNGSVNEDAESDLTKVFGNKFSDSSITSITLQPFSVVNNKGHQRLTINTPTGSWEVGAHMFGANVDNIMKTVESIVPELMEPISDPQKVLNMSKSKQDELQAKIMNMFAGADIKYPQVKIGDNAYRPATVREIARSSNLRADLYDGIRQFIDVLLSVPRDTYNETHMGNVTDANSSTHYIE